MDSKNRGVIQHRERARQINDFSQMRYCRNITPTDIDGAIEFDGKLFIFFELKYGNKDLDFGQRLFLERITSAIIMGGKKAIAIHGKHLVSDTEKSVDASKCQAIKYYSISQKWITPSSYMSLQEIVEAFIIQYGKKEWLNRGYR